MKVMRTLGVPYTEKQIENALEELSQQADAISNRLMDDPQFAKAYQRELKNSGSHADFVPLSDREIIALIAYLQRLGTDATQSSNP